MAALYWIVESLPHPAKLASVVIDLGEIRQSRHWNSDSMLMKKKEMAGIARLPCLNREIGSNQWGPRRHRPSGPIAANQLGDLTQTDPEFDCNLVRLSETFAVFRRTQ
jgi:hypothetical protein